MKQTFTTLQKANQKFWNVSCFKIKDFERMKIWRENIFMKSMFEGKFASQKAFFANFFTARRSSFSFLCAVEKHGRKRKELGKQIRIKFSKVTLISKQLFYMGSNFETRNWKCGRLPDNFLQLVKLWIEIFKAC